MKYLKNTRTTVCLLFLSINLFAQQSLTVEDLVSWKRITDKAISEDGKWVAATVAPWEGDAVVYVYNAKGELVYDALPAEKFAFSPSSAYLLITKTPSKAEKDSLKLKKTKEDDMPMNTLVIKTLPEGMEAIDSLRSYKLSEVSDWMAYQQGRKDSTLYIRSLDGSKAYSFPAVKEYGFAAKGDNLYFLSSGDSLETKAGLYVMDLRKTEPVLVKEGTGVFKQIAFHEKGENLGFLYCEEKDSVYKAMDLWLSENADPAYKVADRTDRAFPAGWVVSEYGKITFSKDGNRLFFGTSPEPRQRDTTQLVEYRPDVQVWRGNEPVQYTVQAFNKEQELKKTYPAVYNLNSRHIVQLADRTLSDLALGDEGNAATALLSTSEPYSLSSMWEGRTRKDYYTVSLETGERKKIKEGDYGNLRLSPRGKFAYWYAETDSCWYTLDMIAGREYRLTTPESFPAWDEDNDVPNYPRAHGIAGWTEDDRALLIYDRYDIWKFDPQGAVAPVNLTRNGRTNRISYRLLKLDAEERIVNLDTSQLLYGFDEVSKGYGYYSGKLSGRTVPEALLAGDFKLSIPLKAKKTDAVIYSLETFEIYPDIYFSDLTFRKITQLTNEGRQQEPYLWGTAEQVSWTSLDGKPLEGVVYKPADFDPSKKYPLIVNFYERNSETLYNYRMPEAHRSTVDYHLYNSNGYIVFNPDVVYVDGYPGESCYNCVMPGVSHLISQGYIDEKAIGAQGHSWGGYQVAYLATRTNLFAAIESGAPVVNMFSAYGGIRWGSGMARAFQYEHTQSRIGGTPWSVPLRFMENSPLFTMDKVTTPILIMHNDSDGHVPWYQGIEYFVALKRLQKPVWMLNYPGEPHWPMKLANRVDFQKRMSQFFDHYLKGEPMPKWMKEGVPAIDRDFELGY